MTATATCSPPPRSGFTLTLPAATSSSPMMSANAAPLASAFFICDLMLPPPALTTIALPASRSISPTREASFRSGLAQCGRRRRAEPPLRTVPASCSSRIMRSMPIANPQADVALAAELLEQTVVAAAAGDGALRAQAVGDPFEHGAIVIVEAADEARVHLRRRCPPRRAGASGRRSGQAICRDHVDEPRRAGDHLLQRRILAVEDAQRVRAEPTARIVVEVGGMLLRNRRRARCDARGARAGRRVN